MKIRILILPKFDIGPLGNGICGEGELFYKEYVEGGTEYELTGLFPGEKLYVKDGIAPENKTKRSVQNSVPTVELFCDRFADQSAAFAAAEDDFLKEKLY
mgnify:CR=1 FL=1